MSKITAKFIEAALREGYILETSKSKNSAPEALVNMAAIELLNLGFLVKPEDINGQSVEMLETLINAARIVVGADRTMKPVYPGFPKQVEALSTTTLLIEQLVYYWSGGTIRGDHPEVIRDGLPLIDMLKASRKLTKVKASVFALESMEEIVTSKISVTPNKRSLLEGAVELVHPTLEYAGELLSRASNGENMALFLLFLKNSGSYSGDTLIIDFAKHCKSTDQLLRLVISAYGYPGTVKIQHGVFGKSNVAIYDDTVKYLDDENATVVFYKTPSKAARRVIVERLGELTSLYGGDYLLKRKRLWRRAMKAIHPYSLNLTPEARRAVDIIHTNIDYKTFASLYEVALMEKNIVGAVDSLAANAPGMLLRSIVSMLRRCDSMADVNYISNSILKLSKSFNLTTLVSAYNGVYNANSTDVSVVKMVGRTNYLKDNSVNSKINDRYLDVVKEALRKAMVEKLSTFDAPTTPLAVESELPVDLSLRDSAVASQSMDRGVTLDIGEGEILRLFGHFRNNQTVNMFMDIGVALLDEDFNKLSVCTWDSWHTSRDWAVYSGDTYVAPKGEAAEFIDVKLNLVEEFYPEAKWCVMTIVSWSGFPIDTIDFVTGAMSRSDGDKGETFDPRTLETVAHPTVLSTQSIPFVVDLKTRKMHWIDSSNGTTRGYYSVSRDETIGDVVRDGLERPRMTYGDLAKLWAEAHGVEVNDGGADVEELKKLFSK